MFTGIIETIGTITSASAKPGGMTLTVCADSTTKNRGQLPVSTDSNRVAATERSEVDGRFAKPGDSISVNGACLTVTSLSGDTIHFDVSKETLSKTTLKTCRPGQSVNLERAMSADARFGGHIVQGHIDGVGKISAIQKQGDFAVFTIQPPAELIDQIVAKGSIALDGISLTVASIKDKTFTVALIPETLSRTIWGKSRVGDTVNIETDVMLKAVQKQLEKIQQGKPGLTEEKLRDLGF